jgi:CheY-like chemotaxis protein
MQADHQRLRVLVVDDNEDAAQVLTLLVGLWGYEAHAALDGVEALAEADHFHPDVVLCDLAMPGKDGCDVAEILSRRSSNEETLLVAVTAFGDNDRRRRAARAGFHAHFVKPVEPDGLHQLLKEHASRVISCA